MRSVALLSDAMKANAANSAPRIHIPKSKVATVSAMAPRPSSWRMTRVLLPSYSASATGKTAASKTGPIRR